MDRFAAGVDAEGDSARVQCLPRTGEQWPEIVAPQGGSICLLVIIDELLFELIECWREFVRRPFGVLTFEQEKHPVVDDESAERSCK
mgnify:CR=1 FL=1